MSPAHRLGNCAIGSLSEAIAFAQVSVFNESIERLEHYQTYKQQAALRLLESGAPAQLRSCLKEYSHYSVFSNGLLTALDSLGDKSAKARLPERPISYFRLQQNLNHMKACITEGFPFVMGLSIYEAFENPEISEGGALNLPGKNDRVIGGHTALCIGYNDNTERFLMRNTCWGNTWGLNGHFTVPYSYLEHPGLARDFWTVRLGVNSQG